MLDIDRLYLISYSIRARWNVQCQCTVYRVHCTLYDVNSKAYNVYYKVYNV